MSICTNRNGVLTSMLIAFALLLAAAVPFAGAKSASAKDAITEALSLQTDAWNNGELDKFMDIYLNSPSISYTAGGVEVNGYEALKKRYVTKYGSKKETMGKLSFADLKITELGAKNALCIGHWHLERDKQPAVDGIFSLVFSNTSDGWKIIHDHTSVKNQKPTTSTDKPQQ
jgi:ketosteroid isomerase-like protein